jgi:DNA-3-methyladenine glycosylase I
MGKVRCAWVNDDPLYIAYHDDEWGVPAYDDARLFEMLILEGAQAGLSWSTILHKRAGYRHAFHEFEAERMALFGEKEIATLLKDKGIVRNRLKINAAIGNARLFLDLRNSPGGFSDYVWQFVGGNPIVNAWKTQNEVPTCTPQSDAMSKDLKRRGFKFVGTTICYAYMQAVGMVNDHTVDCHRYPQIKAMT